MNTGHPRRGCRSRPRGLATLLLACLLLAWTPVGPARAAETGDVEELALDREYFKGILLDTGRVVASPARGGASDWLTAGLVLGATTATIFAVDEPVKDLAQRERSGTTDRLAAVIQRLGDGLVVAPSLAVVYGYGHVVDDARARHTALLGFQSFVIAGAFTNVLKIATQRERPREGVSPLDWNGPAVSLDHLAFPSGHATTAFAVATVVASEHAAHRAVAPIAYGLAALVALSRINNNDHWASDVLFGAAVGHVTARAVVALHRRRAAHRAMVLPVTDGRSIGLVFSGVF